jgi:hypothetical protein
VAGALYEDGDGMAGEMENSANGAGAAYVFTRNTAGDWIQQVYLKASNADGSDVFAGPIALDGDRLAISAQGEAGNGTGGEADNSAPYAGAVYVLD